MAESPQEWQGYKPPTETELFEMNKYQLLDMLTSINDTEVANLDLTEEARQKLVAIKQNLDILRIEHPEDEELRQLYAYYSDLSQDLTTNRDLHLDSSFQEILTEMQREIQTSGVRTEMPEQSSIPEIIRRLRELNINPSYVVTIGNPQAKTVVLFTQIHPNPGLSEETMENTGVKKSQQQIYEAVIAAERSGLTNLFFGEGFPGRKSAPDMVSTIPRDNPTYTAVTLQAEYRAKHELGNNIDVVGIEDWNLLTGMLRSGTISDYRTTAHNVLLADNVADRLNNSDQSIAFMSLGMMHETMPEPRREHPLPISHILAYDNVNVVVVDAASPYLNLEAIPPEEIEKFKRIINSRE